ncbi:MAG TPA: MFS transporter [Coxiellaceae bacterium]|nr:MFS transporter [Coxiellaceae bacterium]
MGTNWKIILASMIGNALELYDFVLYGVFSTIFAHEFFSHQDPHTAILSALSVFAVGYLARPIGGILCGHFGDKFSRRGALVFTISTMGIATCLIGLLPTYSMIGITSVVLLVFLRLIQGLAVGGEYPGSVVILSEQAPPGHKAFFSALAFVGATGGLLIGSAIANIFTHFLSPASLQSWGWRIPFILSLGLAGLGLYIRLKLWDFSRSSADKDAPKIPILTICRDYKFSLLKGLCIAAPLCILTSITMVFIATYFNHFLHYSLPFSIATIFVLSALMLICFPLGALLADCLGENYYSYWMIGGNIMSTVAVYPCFLWMQHGPWSALMAISCYTFIASLTLGPSFTLVVNLFPPEVRYSGSAVTFDIATALLMGTSPLLMVWLIDHIGLTAPAGYLLASTTVAIAAILWKKRKLTEI